MTNDLKYTLLLQDEFTNVIQDALDGARKLERVNKNIDIKAVRRANELKRRNNEIIAANKGTSSSFQAIALSSVGFAAAFLAIKSVAKTISSFDIAMSEVKVKTKASTEEIKKLRTQSIELGKTTKFTAIESANAQAILAQGGKKTNEILGMMPNILDLAASNSISLADSASIASSAMSQFNLGIGETKMTVDLLASASSNSRTKILEIGDAMMNFGPVASSMNISIGNTISLIGALAEGGRIGAAAGTGLKIIFQRLVKPTKEVNDGLALMGLNAKDISPAFNEPVVIFEKFKKGLNNIKDESLRSKASILVFGSEASATGNILVNQTEKIRELNAEQKKSVNIAKIQARVMRDNLGGDIDALNATIQGLTLEVGDSGLTGALRKVTQTATIFIGALNKSEDIRNTTDAIEGMLDIVDLIKLVVSPALDGLNKLFTIIGKIDKFKEKGVIGYIKGIGRATGSVITETAGKMLMEEKRSDVFIGGKISKKTITKGAIEDIQERKRIEAYNILQAKREKSSGIVNGNIDINISGAPANTNINSNLETNTKIGMNANLTEGY